MDPRMEQIIMQLLAEQRRTGRLPVQGLRGLQGGLMEGISRLAGANRAGRLGSRFREAEMGLESLFFGGGMGQGGGMGASPYMPNPIGPPMNFNPGGGAGGSPAGAAAQPQASPMGNQGLVPLPTVAGREGNALVPPMQPDRRMQAYHDFVQKRAQNYDPRVRGGFQF